jgi:heme O synthase-like polyprenyltransferase
MKSDNPVITAKPTRRHARTLAREYYELTKPRVVSLIVFTAVVGMFLAVPGMGPGTFPWCAATVGIGLAAGSAAEHQSPARPPFRRHR